MMSETSSSPVPSRVCESTFQQKAWLYCGITGRSGDSRGPSALTCVLRSAPAARFTPTWPFISKALTFQPIDAKPSLTLNFDKFAPGQRFHGLTKIHLNNSVQDPSYLCEQFARELFVAVGVPSPRATPALLNLNGRDLGVSVLVEGANKQFVKRNFASTRAIFTMAALEAMSPGRSKWIQGSTRTIAPT
jgi:hypothetical protein